MHVLVVCQYFWPESFRINDLAQGLIERGHQVTVLTGMPNYPKGQFFEGYGWFKPKRETYEGINIIRVPLFPRGKANSICLVLNYLSFVFSACLLGPWRCRDRYDVSLVYQTSPVTQGLPAMLLKWLRKTPMVFYVQDLWPESLSATGAITNKKVLAVVAKVVRWIYRCSDRLLVQSKGFIENIVAVGGEQAKIHYLPNSAESLYQPITVPADAPEREVFPSGFCLLFAGNMGEAQDFSTVVAAMEKLKAYPDIHLLVLGDGRKRTWVEAEIAKRDLQGNVHLLGRHPMEKMPTYFALADALLVTLKDEPIFSLTIPAKIQSYLACAKPVVAGLGGSGAAVIEESQSGVVAAPEDPEALAQAILRLYQLSAAERVQMGENGYSYFQKTFAREVILDQLEAQLAV